MANIRNSDTVELPAEKERSDQAGLGFTDHWKCTLMTRADRIFKLQNLYPLLHRVLHADRTWIKQKMNFAIANRDLVKKQVDPMNDSIKLRSDNDIVMTRYAQINIFI